MIPERLLVKRQEDFHYPIVFQQTFEKLTQEVLDLKKDSARICIVTDSHVAPLYLDQVKEALSKTGMTVSSYVLPAGEANKNLEQIQGIYGCFRWWSYRGYDRICGCYLFKRD